MFVKVKPKKSSFKLGICAKSALRYFEPFEILGKLGSVAYQLALPPKLKIPNVFHVSILKKYIHDSIHVIDWNVIQAEPKGYFPMEWN